MKTYSFEKLQVWQKGRIYVKRIYQLTERFPKEETYGLKNQIRRAAVSVTSNLAEGSGKTSGAEKARYTKMAFSSLMESLSQLINATDLDYIREDEVNMLRPSIDDIANMLSALRRSQLNSKP